jgi:hypothetical protein
MLNSTTWLYGLPHPRSYVKEEEKLIETTGAEVLPIALRSRVMGLAAASHFIVNVGITEAGPSVFLQVEETKEEERALLMRTYCRSRKTTITFLWLVRVSFL